MFIHKCPTPALDIAGRSEFTLTYEQIQKCEGVYQIEGYADVRLLVIRNDFKAEPLVLYYTASRLESASTVWHFRKFRKVDESVYMEIK